MSSWELFNVDPSASLCLPLDPKADPKQQTKHAITSNGLGKIGFEEVCFTHRSSLNVSSKHEDVSKTNVQRAIRSVLSDSGLKQILANSVLRLSYSPNPRHARTASSEAISAIREARIAWETGINEELIAMATELKRPFARIMSNVEVHPLLEQVISTAARDNVRFLFDSEDLLTTLLNIKIKDSVASPRQLSAFHIHLPLPSLHELSNRYQDLSPGTMHLGLDELNPEYGVRYMMARHNEGETIMSRGSGLDARSYCMRGCPPALRTMMWRMAFGLPPTLSASEQHDYSELQELCTSYDLLSDDLYIMDILNYTDDSRYFVFEEKLREVMLCFSRDSSIQKQAQYLIHKPLLGLIHNTDKHYNCDTAAPPNAVLPFMGLGAYFCPVSYIARDPNCIYAVTKQLYCQLWCRLNVISSDNGTIMHLCQLFESLILGVNMRLYLHLRRIGLKPLQVAFPWLQLAFVGTLEIDQILILWDRIIGYMDTSLLAVLAAAIFIYRSELLLQVEDVNEAINILSENTRVRVVPLLQMFLFSEEPKSL